MILHLPLLRQAGSARLGGSPQIALSPSHGGGPRADASLRELAAELSRSHDMEWDEAWAGDQDELLAGTLVWAANHPVFAFIGDTEARVAIFVDDEDEGGTDPRSARMAVRVAEDLVARGYRFNDEGGEWTKDAFAQRLSGFVEEPSHVWARRAGTLLAWLAACFVLAIVHNLLSDKSWLRSATTATVAATFLFGSWVGRAARARRARAESLRSALGIAVARSGKSRFTVSPFYVYSMLFGWLGLSVVMGVLIIETLRVGRDANPLVVPITGGLMFVFTWYVMDLLVRRIELSGSQVHVNRLTRPRSVDLGAIYGARTDDSKLTIATLEGDLHANNIADADGLVNVINQRILQSRALLPPPEHDPARQERWLRACHQAALAQPPPKGARRGRYFFLRIFYGANSGPVVKRMIEERPAYQSQADLRWGVLLDPLVTDPFDMPALDVAKLVVHCEGASITEGLRLARIMNASFHELEAPHPAFAPLEQGHAVPVPTQFTDGRSGVWLSPTRTPIDEIPHLRESADWYPIAVAKDPRDGAEMIPTRYWPRELLDFWVRDAVGAMEPLEATAARSRVDLT